MNGKQENKPREKSVLDFDRLARYLVVYQRVLMIVTLVTGLTLLFIYLPRDTLLDITRGLLAQRNLIGLLFLFSLLTLSLLWSAGDRLDALVFLYFNQHELRSPWLDRWMWVTTQMGSGIFSMSIAGVLYLMRYRRLAAEIMLGALSLWLFVELVKALTDRARPFLSLATTQVVGWRSPGRSFPSGHTSQAFFLASLLINHFNLSIWLTLILYAIAALVGFTRVYIGMHYPRDVMAGAILGSVWGIIGTFVDSFLIGQVII